MKKMQEDIINPIADWWYISLTKDLSAGIEIKIVLFLIYFIP